MGTRWEQHHSMPGQKLRRHRERLGLRVRDVEQASLKIAEKYHNDEFEVLINRLSEIENRNLLPSVYKLYSLSTIYRLDFKQVMEWYGVPLDNFPADATLVEVPQTHAISFRASAEAAALLPLSLDPGIDLSRTAYLSRMIQQWGKLPLLFLESLGVKEHRYGFIGTDDWFMYPLLQPGTFVMIDEALRRVSNSGWTNEFERPIYFLEHRQGYVCGWCALNEDHLILQPHPASLSSPQVYNYPNEIEVVGQVTGIAMRLDQVQRRRART
jgi:transcriptional regulator with XRE-family HTH domain